jgi:DNA repair exonuclease SbcCD nuclease subunit
VQIGLLPYPNRAQLAATLPDYDKLSPEEADKLVSAHVEAILRGLAAQLDPGKPSILLAHISVDAAEVGAERSIMAGRDITIPLSAIPEEFSFVALGHIHKAQDFSAYGRPNVFYCGSTDRIDFSEEHEEKSYVIIDLEAGIWERVPIPCRAYRTFDYEARHEYFEGWRDYPDEEVQAMACDAICRVRVFRDENRRPDYTSIQASLEAGNCFDFRGFEEKVERVASVRSEEIVTAQGTAEMLGVWHDAKSCQVPLDALVDAGLELEKQVAI